MIDQVVHHIQHSRLDIMKGNGCITAASCPIKLEIINYVNKIMSTIKIYLLPFCVKFIDPVFFPSP